MNSEKLHQCPALVTLQLISAKWKTRILWVLRGGPLGFGEIRRALEEGISPRMLTHSLRELEGDGLIVRSAHRAGRVATTRYRYTEYGATLIPVLDAVGEWGVRHLRRTMAARTDGDIREARRSKSRNP